MFLRALSKLSTLTPGFGIGFKIEQVIKGWSFPSPEALSDYWNNRYRNSKNPLYKHKINARHVDAFGSKGFKSPIVAASAWDAKYYLSDDILAKVDRASMSMSLESRAPLLDSRVVEFAMSLPISYRLRNVENKRILREILYKRIPRELVDRPKQGFSIPIGRWLREDLRAYAENSLQILKQTSMFDPEILDEIWLEHTSNQKDNSEKLWGLISLAQFIANN